MKISCLAVAAGLALVGALIAPARAETTIVILRHAEKPAAGLGQLSCQGFNRSLALAPLLISRYGAPVAVYAPDPAVKKEDKGVAYAYVRPLATIEPTAVRAGLPVNVDWGMMDIGPLADRLLALTDGTQFVAWEHRWGTRLARQLMRRAGGDAAMVPAWSGKDFDSLYVIRIATDVHGVRHAVFRHEHEHLDHMPTSCDAGPAPDAAPH